MRRHAPVFALFFLAPFIAEYLSGTTFPIVLIFLIVGLAPFYGGGVLLIREVVRRTGRGWPSIVLLGLAFGVLEEGLLTQSLFNPNYADQRLLDFGYVPALGIGIPWTLYVLAGHVIWSVSTPIEIVEESTRERRLKPWLGRTGLMVTVVLFLIGCVASFAISQQESTQKFTASAPQLISSAVIVVVLVAAAFLLPHGSRTPASGWVPAPWQMFVVTLVAGALMYTGFFTSWWPLAAAMMVVGVVGLGVVVLLWSRREGWGRWQRLAVAAGILGTSGWHAFTLDYDSIPLDIASRVIYLLAAAWIIRTAIRRTRREDAPAVEPEAGELTTP